MASRHRWVTEEPVIPFDLRIVYEDDAIIVVDKPHFLATTPRGMWYQSTALMRLRTQLGNSDITPAHRLDRATAGIVLFVKDPKLRGAYQMLFQQRQVRKLYECIAAAKPLKQAAFGITRLSNPPAVFPLIHRSRIIKRRGTLQAFESPGEANSVTRIDIAANQDVVRDANDQTLASCARAGAKHLLRVYALHPYSGKTHQLRVHMNAIGLPILGDDLYPTVRSSQQDDFSHPLQLVARSLEFIDPVSHTLRHFVSTIALSAQLAPRSFQQC